MLFKLPHISKARAALVPLLVLLATSCVVTLKYRERDIPICRLRASYHLSSVRSHYGCGPGQTAALSVSETLQVQYHTLMCRFFSSAAEFTGEPPVELSKLRNYGLGRRGWLGP
jgi:hypothetical protein